MGTALLDNLLSAPVLFFALGLIACWVRSDLEVPQPIPKLLSLYLLVSIGLKGGVALRDAGLHTDVVAGLGAAVVLAAAVPVWTFFLLQRRLGPANAAGVAATYGSISAVTFIIATAFLDGRDVAYGGHMVAAMALMESPAIVVGILLARYFAKGVGESRGGDPGQDALCHDRASGGGGEKNGWGALLHESAFNSAVLLLVGSMAIGLLIGTQGYQDVAAFTSAPFKGVLCLFLLDMGLVAAKRLESLKQAGPVTVGFAVLSPPVHATLGIGAAYVLGLGPGDALLLAVLAGSASYIAVPAALRMALPEANPSLYVPMSLGLTFPFNVVLGIPLYWAMVQWMWAG